MVVKHQINKEALKKTNISNIITDFLYHSEIQRLCIDINEISNNLSFHNLSFDIQFHPHHHHSKIPAPFIHQRQMEKLDINKEVILFENVVGFPLFGV